MFIRKSLYVKGLAPSLQAISNIDHTKQNTDILSMKNRLLPAFLGLFMLSTGAFGAEITIPNLELVTQGAMEDGDFELRSSMEAEIAISGGYKYGFSLGLGAEITNLEKAISYGRLELVPVTGLNPTDVEYNEMIAELNDRYNNTAVIGIRSIKATIRELFNLPLDLSFFVGHNDKLGSGEDFPEYFGTPEIGTSLKGFFYYPEGFNGDPFLRFNGAIHTIMGTGLALKANFGNMIPSLYIYHDLSFPKNQSLLGQAGSFDSGRYSVDAQFLFNGENIKFEVFFGNTYSTDSTVVLRGGIMAFFSSEPFSFLMQAGIPHWEVKSAFDIDSWYFLMEPRLRFEKIGVYLTFFYHPVYYRNRVLYDDNGIDQARGRADINLRVFYGDINKFPFETGLETLINLKIQNGEDASLWISPFITMVTSGLRWDLVLRFNPRYFSDKGDLMEGFIGIRTSY